MELDELIKLLQSTDIKTIKAVKIVYVNSDDKTRTLQNGENN